MQHNVDTKRDSNSGAAHFTGLSDSAELAEFILRGTKDSGAETTFTCPLGMGGTLLQRVRMRITRARKRLQKHNAVIARFQLSSTVVPNVEHEVDIVTVKRVITSRHETHQLMEQIGIIGRGAQK